MLEPRNIKRGEFAEMPDHYLDQVARRGIPLVVRMMEGDHVDVAIVRERDYLALMRLNKTTLGFRSWPTFC